MIKVNFYAGPGSSISTGAQGRAFGWGVGAPAEAALYGKQRADGSQPPQAAQKKSLPKGRLPYFNTIVTTLIKNHAKKPYKIGLNIKKKAAKKAAFFV